MPPKPMTGKSRANHASRKLRRDDIVASILSPSGEYERYLTLGGLAQERKSKAKDEFQDELVGKILVVDARFGGLKDGLLDEAAMDSPTADGSDEWGKQAGFRMRRATSDDYESKDEDWRFEDDFVLRSDGNGDPEEWLVVEHYKSAAQTEDARSISGRRSLPSIKTGPSRGPGELPRRSAFPASPPKRWRSRLPCTTRARRRRAGSALSGRNATRRDTVSPALSPRRAGRSDQAILDGYRHEFGSLPYVEAKT